jgi:aspartyl/asparaginyl beta-hydroxylase (cupin superfamily)
MAKRGLVADWTKHYRQLGLRKFPRWLLLKRIGKPLFRRLDRFMAAQSLVGDQELFDPALFPWLPALEASSKEIRAELDRLLPQQEHLPTFTEIQPDQYKINRDAGWKTFWFMGFGTRSEQNLALCPATAQALAKIPDLETAMFSILAPGLHIPKHAGVTKGVLRCHLGLKIPRDAEKVRMAIGSTGFSWQEGKAVVFDDTFKHEVWNDTDEERVVLFFDFRRPMRWPGRLAYAIVHAALNVSPFMRDARRNQRKWEREHRGAFEPPPAGLEAYVR